MFVNHYQIRKKVDEVETDVSSVYSINMSNLNSVTNVKINDYTIKMQVDTGSQVTIIPRNFWELMSKPKLQKCYLRLKRFDGTIIKVLGELEATLETKTKINIVRIIVADCTKNHVNSVEPVVSARLVNYKANIIIKNGMQPSYFESRPLPIHIQPLVIEKLNEMIQQGLLIRVPPGGSKWASPLVVKNVSEDSVVSIYDINKDLELTTDASEKAISGILSQNGHPVLFSRSLSDAETRYFNIEREALAIVWSTHRARHFQIGRRFMLISDHRPLEFIFDCNKELLKVTSARILRWALQMMAFDYDISYKKGESIPHADALSRLSFFRKMKRIFKGLLYT
ncbi:uncharacterized protein LOC136079465 [Hydra vulgaris]|uniref:Uncharacterized protein LOC136079465 n=1 Tax=Hydra vulgaris TaxID=6087 RepID=A0ABM4BQ57_HYDVU